MSFSDLRLRDLVIFISVARTGSLSAAARSLDTTTSQVSKSLARLEKQIGAALLTRGARGVHLSEAGQRVLPSLEAAMSQLSTTRQRESVELSELTVAAPSFLQAQFLGAIAEGCPESRVRGLELAPAELRAQVNESFFDVALMLDEERLPKNWVSERAGVVRRALFGSPRLAAKLGRQPVSESLLAEVPFVGPVLNIGGTYVPADDDCPIRRERKIGHQAQTIGLALDLASRTDQLVFGPAIAARQYLAEGTLVEIEVQGWDVRSPLFVACNADRVRASAYKQIVRAVRDRLAALEGT